MVAPASSSSSGLLYLKIHTQWANWNVSTCVVCILYTHHVSFLCVYIQKKPRKKINFLIFFSSRISSPLSRLLFSLKKNKLNGASVTWCAPRSIFHGVDVTLRRASKNGISPPKFPPTFQHGSNLLLPTQIPLRFYLYFWTFRTFRVKFPARSTKKSSQFSSL